MDKVKLRVWPTVGGEKVFNTFSDAMNLSLKKRKSKEDKLIIHRK